METDFIMKRLIEYNNLLNVEKFDIEEDKDLFIILKEEFFLNVDIIKDNQQNKIKFKYLNENIDNLSVYDIKIRKSIKKCERIVITMKKEMKKESIFKNQVENYQDVYTNCSNIIKKIKQMDSDINKTNTNDKPKQKLLKIGDATNKKKKGNSNFKGNEDIKEIQINKKGAELKTVKERRTQDELYYEEQWLENWAIYDKEIDNDLLLVSKEIEYISKVTKELIYSLNKKDNKLLSIENKKEEIKLDVEDSNSRMKILYKKFEQMSSFHTDIIMIIVIYIIIGIGIYIFKKLKKSTG